jgi:DNA-binding response OmpR family regulator
VVEDDLATHNALQLILQRRGWEVTVATTVADALNQLDESVSLVVLDLMLPDGDGLKVLKHIRAQGWAACVVVTTGVSDPLWLREARQLGADMILRKPIELKDLLAALPRGSTD